MQRGRSGFRGGGRGRGRGRSTAKGLFADSTWLCDCSPRLPAEHFKVKKEGPNKGRFFYTCQQQEPKRCGFFLWDEDAEPRMAATVMANSTTEPQQSRRNDQTGGISGKGLFAPPLVEQERDESRTPTPSPTPTPQSTTSGSKRSAESAGFESDDNYGLNGSDNDELERIADSFETPHKALKTGVYATPASTVRKLQLKDPESVTEPADEYLATPSKPSSKTLAHASTPSSLGTIQTPDSPSPQARFQDALSNPADSASSLTSEVLSHLSSLRIPPDKISTLRTILSRHDLQAMGVKKGRDISRLALKAKDAKILELQSKIVTLEAERELHHGVIQKLRWEQQHGREDDD